MTGNPRHPSPSSPPKLTATQARSLLHTLLTSDTPRRQTSMPANSACPSSTSASPPLRRPVHPQSQSRPQQQRQSQTQARATSSNALHPAQNPQQTLHVDASTKLMGHMNHLTLPSPSVRIEDLEKILSAVAPIFTPPSSPSAAPAASATAAGGNNDAQRPPPPKRQKQNNITLNINTGISIAGSRNVISFSPPLPSHTSHHAHTSPPSPSPPAPQASFPVGAEQRPRSSMAHHSAPGAEEGREGGMPPPAVAKEERPLSPTVNFGGGGGVGAGGSGGAAAYPTPQTATFPGPHSVFPPPTSPSFDAGRDGGDGVGRKRKLEVQVESAGEDEEEEGGEGGVKRERVDGEVGG